MGAIVIGIGVSMLVAYLLLGYRIHGGGPGTELAFAAAFLVVGTLFVVGGAHYRRKYLRIN